MFAPAPAPRSTAISRPRPLSFLTVSGVAATRASPSRRSLRTASFTSAAVGAEEHEEEHQKPDQDQRPDDELREQAPGLLVLSDVHSTRLVAVIACHSNPLNSRAGGL